MIIYYTTWRTTTARNVDVRVRLLAFVRSKKQRCVVRHFFDFWLLRSTEASQARQVLMDVFSQSRRAVHRSFYTWHIVTQRQKSNAELKAMEMSHYSQLALLRKQHAAHIQRLEAATNDLRIAHADESERWRAEREEETQRERATVAALQADCAELQAVHSLGLESARVQAQAW